VSAPKRVFGWVESKGHRRATAKPPRQRHTQQTGILSNIKLLTLCLCFFALLLGFQLGFLFGFVLAMPLGFCSVFMWVSLDSRVTPECASRDNPYAKASGVFR